MLRSLKEILGYRVVSAEGDLGKVQDFYLDDLSWVIRYLVVETGGWLLGKRVLLSPLILGRPDWETGTLPVGLTRRQVEESPDIDLDQPVSRHQEIRLFRYYGWPFYWASPAMQAPPPEIFAPGEIEEDDPLHPGGERNPETDYDPHLRSSREVLGYHIRASDESIGHVEDFIVEDAPWVVRYLVIDTRNWLPFSKKVLLAMEWITGITWAESRVYVDLSREMVEKSPEFDPSLPVNREYEVRLYDFYGRPKYWE